MKLFLHAVKVSGGWAGRLTCNHSVPSATRSLSCASSFPLCSPFAAPKFFEEETEQAYKKQSPPSVVVLDSETADFTQVPPSGGLVRVQQPVEGFAGSSKLHRMQTDLETSAEEVVLLHRHAGADILRSILSPSPSPSPSQQQQQQQQQQVHIQIGALVDGFTNVGKSQCLNCLLAALRSPSLSPTNHNNTVFVPLFLPAPTPLVTMDDDWEDHPTRADMFTQAATSQRLLQQMAEGSMTSLQQWSLQNKFAAVPAAETMFEVLESVSLSNAAMMWEFLIQSLIEGNSNSAATGQQIRPVLLLDQVNALYDLSPWYNEKRKPCPARSKFTAIDDLCRLLETGIRNGYVVAAVDRSWPQQLPFAAASFARRFGYTHAQLQPYSRAELQVVLDYLRSRNVFHFSLNDLEREEFYYTTGGIAFDVAMASASLE